MNEARGLHGFISLILLAGCASEVGSGTGDATEDETTDGDDGADADSDSDTAEEEEEPDWSCENPPTESVIDLALLTVCCDGAHCVPAAFVELEQAENLAACDEDAGYCVPDPFIETQGFMVPTTCQSLAGAEGRCLSICIPQVAEQLDRLPQSTCAANERCSPCCDPMSGEPTGACDQMCDVGPAGECAPAFPTCCEDASGHCIPRDLVPDEDEESLEDCGGDMACVPDVMQDEAFEGTDCVGQGLMGEYDGVCLPDCLALDMEWSMDAAPCPERHVCVPCSSPFGGETGAPGCEPPDGGDDGGFGGW